MKLILLFSLVSLFSDMTYEGARSIIGPYLAFLGANATNVGFVAGLGEFLGYSLRLVSGWLSDKLGKYWCIAIMGYLMNLFSVPALSFVNCWEWAAGLILIERIGKALRTPPRDAMLSYVTSKVGHGWGFGIHEALDQIGAMLGPLLVAGFLYFNQTYKEIFKILFIPAVLAILFLILAKSSYSMPESFKIVSPKLETKGLNKIYWLYLIGAGLNGAGYIDFALIAYHFEKTGLVSSQWIPIFYTIAMGTDALTALLFGYLFDKKGFKVLIFSILLSVSFVPFCFLGSFKAAFLGIILWGIGIGAQESIMRAGIAYLVPIEKRATGYGLFSTGYGLSWFLGSTVLGILYSYSLTKFIIFSIILQLISLVFFLKVAQNFDK